MADDARVKNLTLPVMFVMFSSVVSAGDWPWALGPQRDGVSPEVLPETWNPEVAWTRQVGVGYSGFAVADGRAYVTGHVAGKEYVFCLDAATGEQRWNHSYEGGKVDNLHKGGPAATVTVDGDRLFVVGREGQFHCLEAATGEVVWRRELTRDLGVKVPEWGFSSSPLVRGEQVVLQGGPFAAYDKASGEPAWRTGRDPAGYGAPMMFELDGKLFLATLTNAGLLITDPAGKEVARQTWKTSFKTNGTTPLVHGGQIFISTGYRRGCGLYRFDGATLAEVYQNKALSTQMDTAVRHGELIFGIDGNERYSAQCTLRCLDWASGEVKWQQGDVGCGSVIRAGDDLLVLTESGTLLRVAASGDGYEEKGRLAVLKGGRCWSAPALADGAVFVRNDAGFAACVQLKP